MATFRPYTPADADRLAACAVACGQMGPTSAHDRRYQEFVAQHGSLVVADDGMNLVGFAGVIERSGASYLTDLFVRPENQNKGLGRRLLAQVWVNSGPRMTSASQDPRALALYAQAGLTPRWANLYLELPGISSSSISDTSWDAVEFRAAKPGDCGWWLGTDATSVATLRGPDGTVRACAVLLDNGESTLQLLRAVTPDPDSLAELVVALQTRAGAGRRLSLNIPDRHPVAKVLGAAHVVDQDIWCTTDDAAWVVDPEHVLPSPALG